MTPQRDNPSPPDDPTGHRYACDERGDCLECTALIDVELAALESDLGLAEWTPVEEVLGVDIGGSD